MRIGSYRIHRSEQWDLGKPSITPLIVVHRRAPGISYRVFCLWVWGVQIGSRYWPEQS